MSNKDQHPESSKPNLSDEAASRIRQTVIGNGKGIADKATATPKSTRFQKGQSGNPKGRPKKTANAVDLPDVNPLDLPINAALMAFLEKTFTIKSGNGAPDTVVTGVEALFQWICKSSNDGNALAHKLLLDHGLRLQEDIRVSNLKSYKIWQTYKELKTAEIHAAIETGLPEPVFYPHPDDVILEWPDKVILTGPYDEASAQMWQLMCDFRDVLMIQDILDHRSEFVCLEGQPSMLESTQPQNGLGPRNGSFLLAGFINQLLVPRLRRELDPSDCEYIQYRRLTKRQLKPAVQKKWKEIGIKVPSGFVFPDTNKVHAALQELTEIFFDWKSRNYEQAEEFVTDLYDIILDAQRA